jgi:hypothetical protein
MINISQIQATEKKRRQLKKEIYTEIYKSFSRKIQQCVTYGKKNIILNVPSFVMGQPTFDRASAAKYLKRQLELGGFTAQLVSEYDIYCSWATPKKETINTRTDPDPDPGIDTSFSSFINLKKTASKYRDQ